MIAFILLTIRRDADKDILDDIKNKILNFPYVIEVNPLFGEYDLIVKVENDDVNNIAKFVIEKIRKIDGVNDTKTLVGQFQ
ncbi:MAG: Lrp/AsnC family transcriptional regulator [Atribacterota bacterium]